LFNSNKKKGSHLKKLIAIACVLAVILAVMIGLLIRGRNGGTQTPSATTETNAVTTTVPTTTTTRLTAKTSTAANSSELLVNIPAENADAKAALQAITQLCKAQNGRVSFYYMDLESGYSVEYRADRAYQAASVIKAPYVKWLLESGVDGNEKLTMQSSDKQGGSGVVDKEPAGTQFTVDQLMENAVRFSDNTAYYMLNKRFGFKEFNAYAEKLGIKANANSNCVLTYPRPRFGYLSARDIGLYMADIAKYIEMGSDDAKRLKTWMTSTSEESQLVEAYRDTYTVAHKYGDTKNIENAFHDGGIVYHEHPFVLAVATSLEPFAPASITFYHELAKQAANLHNAYHAN
jgi:beta-lactamase class A